MARIAGKAAAFYINISGSWTFFANLYDWQIDYDGVTLDASIKGDAHDRHVFSHIRGRLSAKRWVSDASFFAMSKLITTGARYDWAVVTVDPNAYGSGFNPNTWDANTNARAQGTGYFTRVQMHAPRGLVEDNCELVIDSLGSIV